MTNSMHNDGTIQNGTTSEEDTIQVTQVMGADARTIVFHTGITLKEALKMSEFITDDHTIRVDGVVVTNMDTVLTKGARIVLVAPIVGN